MNIELLLFFSSFIFITNAISTCYKEYYVYCMLFLFLTVTSLIYHYTKNEYVRIVDKVAILGIVLYGGYMLYKKASIEKYLKIILIVLTFLITIFLYYYGFLTKRYCYDPEKCVGDLYHALLHVISSIGHHLITFL
jgi:hypothetical protein